MGVDELEVDLAHDWRADPPAVTDIGPVLSMSDAIAGKTVMLLTSRNCLTTTQWPKWQLGRAITPTSFRGASFGPWQREGRAHLIGGAKPWLQLFNGRLDARDERRARHPDRRRFVDWPAWPDFTLCFSEVSWVERVAWWSRTD